MNQIYSLYYTVSLALLANEPDNNTILLLLCSVFRVPETATILMSGGISFGELNQEQVKASQDMLLEEING